jgi:hypothetical protein
VLTVLGCSLVPSPECRLDACKKMAIVSDVRQKLGSLWNLDERQVKEMNIKIGYFQPTCRGRWRPRSNKCDSSSPSCAHAKQGSRETHVRVRSITLVRR